MPNPKRQRKKQNSHARQAAILEAQRRRARTQRIIAAVVVTALIAGLATFIYIATGGSKSKKVATSTTTTTAAGPTTTAAPGDKTVALSPVPQGETIKGDTPCPKADGSAPRVTQFAKAPPMCIDPAKTYTAVMKTSKGTITITLDAKKAPKTVNNFVVLSRYHFYEGIAFHRIIPDFVDQVGDPFENGSGGPGYKFEDELPSPGDYKAGSVAMANSGPNTNGSQIFLIVSDNGAKSLVEAVNGKAAYSLFGQITGGLDVAQAINKAGTEAGQPTEVIKIESITIQES